MSGDFSLERALVLAFTTVSVERHQPNCVINLTLLSFFLKGSTRHSSNKFLGARSTQADLRACTLSQAVRPKCSSAHQGRLSLGGGWWISSRSLQ